MQATATTDVEALVGRQRATRALPLGQGERRAEAAAAALFVLVAVPLALSGWSGTPWRTLQAVVLVLSYAAATRARFETGLGSTDVSLLVFVPMLFVLPAELVPLLCAAGLLAGRLPDYVRGDLHPSRALAVGGNSLHALGPATVIALGVDGGPRWGDWPWYLAALAAYVVCDTAAALGREWLAHGVRPRLQVRVLGEVYALDALFAPVGLMAAFATTADEYAYLLAAPLLGVLSVLARERAGRLDRALELSESRAALLEAELAATRSREEVLAAVSHGLQTPLATVIGLADLLAARGEQLPPERRRQAVVALREESEALRQLVRQALDYVSLRAGRELRVALEDVDVAALARGLAGVDAGGDERVVAHADAARTRQVLLALAAQARRAGAEPRIEITAVPAGGARIALALPGEPPTEADGPFAAPDGAGDADGDEAAGTGVDLYVAHELCRVMGGALTAERERAGWSLVATLPPASG